MTQPPGWTKAPLGDLFDLYQPRTLTRTELDPNGEYYVYGANGIIGRHTDFNHARSEVAIGCRGSCGNVIETVARSWINGNAMVAASLERMVFDSVCTLSLVFHRLQPSDNWDGNPTDHQEVPSSDHGAGSTPG